MTPADKLALHDELKRLGRAFQKAVSEDQVDEYFEDLADYDLRVVQRALGEVRRSSRYFPRVADIRAACATITGRTVERGLMPDLDPGCYVCERCDDTGWILIERATGHLLGRVQAMELGHQARYARPCPCQPTNAAYQYRHPLKAERATPGSASTTPRAWTPPGDDAA